MEQIQNAVLAAFEEFKKEFGENAKLEEGDEFVTTVFQIHEFCFSFYQWNLTFVAGQLSFRINRIIVSLNCHYCPTLFIIFIR